MEIKTEVEAKWLMNTGKDVGQRAAEAFVQCAKQEQELENMTRTWEQALELESSDSKSSDGMRKGTSELPESHQPPSQSRIGSTRSTPTILESASSTDPEGGCVEGPQPTIPESTSSTDPEARCPDEKGIYPNRLLPTIPEGAELLDQHPTDP